MQTMAEDKFASALRLRRELIETIDKFVNSEAGKNRGYHSRADFIDKAIRQQLEAEKPKLEHVNTFEDHAKIADYELHRIVSIYFKDGQAWCDHHESTTCYHIDYALSLPEVKKALKEHGWKRKNG